MGCSLLIPLDLLPSKKRLNAYRYGFNGKEKDNEVRGSGNAYEFGGRSIYDPRLGRFISIDPQTKKFAWQSPYVYAGNNPIANIDQEGEGEVYYILTLDLKTGNTTFRIAKGDFNSDKAHFQLHIKNKDGSFQKPVALTKERFEQIKGAKAKEGKLFDEKLGTKINAPKIAPKKKTSKSSLGNKISGTSRKILDKLRVDPSSVDGDEPGKSRKASFLERASSEIKSIIEDLYGSGEGLAADVVEDPVVIDDFVALELPEPAEDQDFIIVHRPSTIGQNLGESVFLNKQTGDTLSIVEKLPGKNRVTNFKDGKRIENKTSETVNK